MNPAPDIPLPPEDYMELVCGHGSKDLPADYLEIGRVMLRELKFIGALRPGDRVLDVGCGCGRFARQLIGEPIASYTGFDRHRGMVEWCQREIQARVPGFTFLFFDLKSAYDGKDGCVGTVDAARFRFPFAAESFDFVLLASVFTHMPLDECRHYLRELHRTLHPDGRIVLSAFFSAGAAFVDDINFYFEPQAFDDAMREAGFCFDRFADPMFGAQHNWHRLAKTAGA
jgi:SAM-dependent methyltransferase